MVTSCALLYRGVELRNKEGLNGNPLFGKSEYDTFMTDSKVDKSAKSTDIEHKTAKKQDESQALTVKREDLEGARCKIDGMWNLALPEFKIVIGSRSEQ